MSSVFGEAYDVMEGRLKNPNELREAFIFESFSNKSKYDIEKFINSREAKIMCEEGIITYDLLDRLAAEEHADREVELTVCHMARENEDPEWNALVAARAEERRLMNDLIEKYGESATVVAKECKQKYLVDEMPKVFR